MRRIWCGIACSLIALGLIELRQSPATAEVKKPQISSTVYLVRHAEKADDGTNDPPLMQEGVDRANTLADMLADKGIVAIITSKLQRTVQTAAPLAKKLENQATATAISTEDGVVSKVRATKGNVLVVHHSDSVPKIIRKLGGPKLSTICESVYDRFFSLELAGKSAVFKERQYGVPTPKKNC
jgi:phosphohistidine phosphatase SixA